MQTEDGVNKDCSHGCTVCQWLTAMCCTCCPCLWWCVWCMQSIMCHYLWPRPPLHYPTLYNVLDTRLARLSNHGPRSSSSGPHHACLMSPQHGSVSCACVGAQSGADIGDKHTIPHTGIMYCVYLHQLLIMTVMSRIDEEDKQLFRAWYLVSHHI